MAQFVIDISYGQIAFFDARIEDPYNDWSDEHVSQGFAWRPGSVCFGTLQPSGPISVDVTQSRAFDEFSSSALRVIVVPFAVPEHGTVELASIADGVTMQIPAGEYELTFEHGINSVGQMWACFYLRSVLDPVPPKIIRADSELAPPDRLVMIAQPA